MYVCLCNKLTDRAIRDVVTPGAGETVEDVYAELGAQLRCGRCRDYAETLLLMPAGTMAGGALQLEAGSLCS